MERKRLTLNDVLEAKNMFLKGLGYITDLVVVMNLTTFQEIVYDGTPTFTKEQSTNRKKMFGMEIKFNNKLEDGVFCIQIKTEYERSNKMSKFITIYGEEIK